MSATFGRVVTNDRYEDGRMTRDQTYTCGPAMFVCDLLLEHDGGMICILVKRRESSLASRKDF